ncbi:MAG: hypothetical protein PHC61_15415, partial [Chitinivibrionales bacterium]|nr:hypothetical protein [Chitinivibrionales bacterium]
GLHKKRYDPAWMPGHATEFCRPSFVRLLSETGFRLVKWQTYSHKPVMNCIYAGIPVGNKARALIRKIS